MAATASASTPLPLPLSPPPCAATAWSRAASTGAMMRSPNRASDMARKRVSDSAAARRAGRRLATGAHAASSALPLPPSDAPAAAPLLAAGARGEARSVATTRRRCTRQRCTSRCTATSPAMDDTGSDWLYCCRRPRITEPGSRPDSTVRRRLRAARCRQSSSGSAASTRCASVAACTRSAVRGASRSAATPTLRRKAAVRGGRAGGRERVSAGAGPDEGGRGGERAPGGPRRAPTDGALTAQKVALPRRGGVLEEPEQQPARQLRAQAEQLLAELLAVGGRHARVCASVPACSGTRRHAARARVEWARRTPSTGRGERALLAREICVGGCSHERAAVEDSVTRTPRPLLRHGRHPARGTARAAWRRRRAPAPRGQRAPRAAPPAACRRPRALP